MSEGSRPPNALQPYEPAGNLRLTNFPAWYNSNSIYCLNSYWTNRCSILFILIRLCSYPRTSSHIDTIFALIAGFATVNWLSPSTNWRYIKKKKLALYCRCSDCNCFLRRFGTRGVHTGTFAVTYSRGCDLMLYHFRMNPYPPCVWTRVYLYRFELLCHNYIWSTSGQLVLDCHLLDWVWITQQKQRNLHSTRWVSIVKFSVDARIGSRKGRGQCSEINVSGLYTAQSSPRGCTQAW